MLPERLIEARLPLSIVTPPPILTNAESTSTDKLLDANLMTLLSIIPPMFCDVTEIYACSPAVEFNLPLKESLPITLVCPLVTFIVLRNSSIGLSVSVVLVETKAFVNDPVPPTTNLPYVDGEDSPTPTLVPSKTKLLPFARVPVPEAYNTPLVV